MHNRQAHSLFSTQTNSLFSDSCAHDQKIALKTFVRRNIMRLRFSSPMGEFPQRSFTDGGGLRDLFPTLAKSGLGTS
jgi:hypothetical protein